MPPTVERGERLEIPGGILQAWSPSAEGVSFFPATQTYSLLLLLDIESIKYLSSRTWFWLKSVYSEADRFWITTDLLTITVFHT